MALTINKLRLGDLWLPAERAEREAMDYMDKVCLRECMKNSRGRPFKALNRARCALDKQWTDTVRVIRERGGLLLIGGRA